jgi:hypothetical protein
MVMFLFLVVPSQPSKLDNDLVRFCDDLASFFREIAKSPTEFLINLYANEKMNNKAYYSYYTKKLFSLAR